MSDGRIYFIGAGPGDPELLAHKASRVLRQADIILYADSLVSPAIAQFAKPGAEVQGTSGLDLETIVTKMIAAVRAGHIVARLQSGAPSMYGAIHEQIVRVRAAGVPYEIIPGGGWLYVAETGAVRRVRYNALSRTTQGELETIVSDLPTGGHWTRTVRFGPDGWMYVSIGSSCNVCIEDDKRRAAIVRYRPDGTGEELYATGLRNSVGFDWQPRTGALFATDNGRDHLGDDLPPCELNRVDRGGFYGWPYAHGDRVPDPKFGAGHEDRIRASTSPVHGFVAHSSPLGITFYRGSAFPSRYRGAAFVAQHGSWNRSRKSGYRVVLLEWDETTGKIQESDFVQGFELKEDVVGRPVDVAVGPDGALYISDDYAGAVYRVSYDRRR